MKALGTVDTSFLLAESREMPMHTGGLMLFSYPEGAHEDWLQQRFFGNDDPDAVQPPFNQKLVWPLRRLGLPHWVTDHDPSRAFTARACIGTVRSGKRTSSRASRTTGSRST
ncbi:MAG: hypothetical protein JRF55_17005 [Deltaproteobacteria bacterium]|nr:hypothetical protein [Deltaproteobacteria bacterium]